MNTFQTTTSKDESEDLTTLFLRLQGELEPVGIGSRKSLESQLQVVESDLRPLFLNSNNLKIALRAGALTYEHAFLKKTETWSMSYILKLLAEYRTAQKINEDHLFRLLVGLQPDIFDAYEHLVSIAELEVNKMDLKIAPFAKSCLREIADLIESGLFPFLHLRQAVLETCNSESGINLQIENLSLGNLVKVLSKTDRALYCPPPFNLPLSQWRNISYHSSYRQTGLKIQCEYGSRNSRQRVSCSQNQLLDLLKYVHDVYYMHKVSYEIFCIDNINIIKKTKDVVSIGSKLSTVESTHNTGTIFSGSTSGDLYSDSNPDRRLTFNLDVIMAYSIMASGFCILKAGRRDFRWALVLTDLHHRGKEDIETALKDAVFPYLFHKTSVEIHAWVDSKVGRNFITFQGRLDSSKA